ncbi:MAG: nucleoid occlusion factor SlmA [Burkholderiaceae bacterium]|nr:nucleoid occlusion factor SlmA [Burkholderiaceae bacterium]
MPTIAEESEPVPGRRKRLKPGERRVQILQTLAHILEQPGGERVTTALLAGRLQVSEAALYRHFASKAQMFEALLELIESAVDGLVSETAKSTEPGRERIVQLVTRMLAFAEANPGLGRVMAGDALVFEHERLQNRMNAMFERFEAVLKLCLQADGVADSVTGAELILAFTLGRLHLWSRTGFTRKPSNNLQACLTRLLS